jgi:hypothetical protein
VDEVVQDLKAIVGGIASVEKGNKREDKKQKKDKAEQQNAADMLDGSDAEDDAFAAFNARIAAPSSGEDDSGDSVSDNDRPPSIGDSEAEHDPEDDLEADSSSEEEDSFHGFGSNQEDSEAEDAHNDLRVAPASDHSDSESDASSPIDEPAIPTPKPKAKTPKEAITTSSAFLPTLSNSYLPGSESEASDLDEAPRKNRRGQRARQKIAELKHGLKAKHLENQERSKGWDPKRGAVSEDRRGGRRSQQTGENATPLGKKKGAGIDRDDKGELHPSWQAAKLAKEKKMIKIDVSAPIGSGKKVVFD